MPLKQAEAITGAITEVLNDSLENVSRSLVSKEEMQRVMPALLKLIYNSRNVGFSLCCSISSFIAFATVMQKVM